MGLLLDTHTLVWWLAGEPMAPEAVARIADPGEHAERAGEIPPHHRHPFDRMLVAQAQLEALTVVTRDRSFEPYGVPVLAC